MKNTWPCIAYKEAGCGSRAPHKMWKQHYWRLKQNGEQRRFNLDAPKLRCGAEMIFCSFLFLENSLECLFAPEMEGLIMPSLELPHLHGIQTTKKDPTKAFSSRFFWTCSSWSCKPVTRKLQQGIRPHPGNWGTVCKGFSTGSHKRGGIKFVELASFNRTCGRNYSQNQTITGSLQVRIQSATTLKKKVGGNQSQSASFHQTVEKTWNATLQAHAAGMKHEGGRRYHRVTKRTKGPEWEDAPPGQQALGLFHDKNHCPPAIYQKLQVAALVPWFLNARKRKAAQTHDCLDKHIRWQRAGTVLTRPKQEQHQRGDRRLGLITLMGQNEEKEKPPPVVTATLIQTPETKADTNLHLSPVFKWQHAEVSLKGRAKIIYPVSPLEEFKIAMQSSLACFLEGEEWYKA